MHSSVSARLYWPPSCRRIASFVPCATAAPPPDDRQGDDRKGDDRGDAYKGVNDDEPEAIGGTDPVLDKFHHIDPGMLHYQRATFERLFHAAIAPLTGDELKKIMHGRRLQLTMGDASNASGAKDAVILMVYTEPWKNATDDTWNGMAALLSDWSADAVIRELDLTDGHTEPLFIPLKVRRV